MDRVGNSPPEGHDILSDTNRLDYQSLRRRPHDRAERDALGK